MTDKVDSWIWYYDTIYKRTKKLTLGVFLNKINNRTLVNDATRIYFATEQELEDFKNKYYKTDWGLVLVIITGAMDRSVILLKQNQE